MDETNPNQLEEVIPRSTFTPQNPSPLKVTLDGNTAKLGSIFAYEGGVRFDHEGGGLGRFFKSFFKKAVTGRDPTAPSHPYVRKAVPVVRRDVSAPGEDGLAA